MTAPCAGRRSGATCKASAPHTRHGPTVPVQRSPPAEGPYQPCIITQCVGPRQTAGASLASVCSREGVLRLKSQKCESRRRVSDSRPGSSWRMLARSHRSLPAAPLGAIQGEPDVRSRPNVRPARPVRARARCRTARRPDHAPTRPPGTTTIERRVCSETVFLRSTSHRRR